MVNRGGFKIFSIEVSKDYSYAKNWVEDLQALMKLCGFENLPTVFIFRDSQIFVEEVLEDISTILNKGAVASVQASLITSVRLIQGTNNENCLCIEKTR